jgi:thiol-disulfide isomerase/thioredoxin
MKVYIAPLLLVSTILFFSCKTSQPSLSAAASNRNYEIVPDSETKVLRGIIHRSDLENDTTFAWFKRNMQYGTADANAIEALKKNGKSIRMVVFCGTWCHDSQNLLPVFYRMVDKAGFPDSSIMLVAVDRNKTTSNHLEQTYNVTNVPTFIVMKNGKETGRVVEYGKEEQIDKEIGEIVESAGGQ